MSPTEFGTMNNYFTDKESGSTNAWLDKMLEQRRKHVLPKWNDKLHFNQKFRGEQREAFVKLQKSCLHDLEIINNANTIKELGIKATLNRIIDSSGKMIEAIDKIEKEKNIREIRDGKFVLYKETNGRGLVFKSHFYKTLLKKYITIY